MAVQFKDLKVGINVTVSTWNGDFVKGTVDYVDENIKNGYPGIEYTKDNGDAHWCYLHQIVRINR
jgi:hypothetical protein